MRIHPIRPYLDVFLLKTPEVVAPVSDELNVRRASRRFRFLASLAPIHRVGSASPRLLSCLCCHKHGFYGCRKMVPDLIVSLGIFHMWLAVLS